jgi:hypothetical protein
MFVGIRPSLSIGAKRSRVGGGRHRARYRWPVVLVAFVLVLLAAASFAAGIAASRTSDALVYVSIVFSLAAFVVLAIASLRARRAERETTHLALSTQPMRTIDETEAHAGPLLGGLDPTQLDMTPSWRRRSRDPWEVDDPVLDREEDELLEEQLEQEEDEADFEVPVEPVARAARADEFGWELDDDDALDVSELEPEPEPEPEPDLDVATAVGSFFDEYDDLTAAEILAFLDALDLEGLKWVRGRERSGAKRTTVLTEVERLVVARGGRPSRAPARKTTAKKAAPASRTAKKSAKTTKSTRRR